MAKKSTRVPVTDDTKAAAEESTMPSPTPAVTSKLPTPTVIKSIGQKKPWPKWAWYVIAGVVVLAAAGLLGWKLFGQTNVTATKSVVNSSTNINGEALVPRVLDGVPVPASQANTNIYAIVIENMVDARPQSGLDKASVVYETLAEGGITRFLSLFPVGLNLSKIGPVRSARSYFISWAEEYHPLFVHAGGSPQALATLRSSKTNVYDFNQFFHGGSFIRDDSRAAPHNLYTDTDKLFMGLRRAAPDAKPTYTSWTFKGETPLDTRPATVNDLVINFSSFTYKVTYKYNRGLNTYQRYIADKPQLTLDNNPINAKDIVVQFEKVGLIPKEKQRLDIQTIGTGKMLVFRDGTVTEGTWKKDSGPSRTQFLDASGNALALNPGQIWIDTVPIDGKITY